MNCGKSLKKPPSNGSLDAPGSGFRQPIKHRRSRNRNHCRIVGAAHRVYPIGDEQTWGLLKYPVRNLWRPRHRDKPWRITTSAAYVSANWYLYPERYRILFILPAQAYEPAPKEEPTPPRDPAFQNPHTPAYSPQRKARSAYKTSVGHQRIADSASPRI